MTIEEAINTASNKINATDAEMLLRYILKKDQIYLYTNPDHKLSPTHYELFKKIVEQIQNGKPFAYITHQKEFYGLDFYVDENVLIPRPETEILVDEAIKIANSLLTTDNGLIIADVGTGSGCIAIAIAKNLRFKNYDLRIFATDISKDALRVAQINTKKHKVASEIKFLRGDLLNPLPEQVDIIIANLPYVNMELLKQKITEPKIALDGGKNGFEIIEKLLKQSPHHLKPNGKIFLEIDPQQKTALRKTIPEYLPSAEFEFGKDLAGSIRIAIISP